MSHTDKYKNIEGCLVVSLDFELMWGMHDVSEKEGYGRTNVKNVPLVIDRMVDLFRLYGVHATFATVGMIMYHDKEELMNDIPELHPSYINTKCSVYENDYLNQIQKNEECLFFQPEVVSKLKNTEGIEVATHTYCHYYCWEKGQTSEQFESDLKKAVEVAKRNGLILKSIIFPRNQVPMEYLDLCKKQGITSYRGNAKKYFERPVSTIDALRLRICRFIDSYFNIGGNTTISFSELMIDNSLINIRASRLIRPFCKTIRVFEGLRLRRIKKEMEYAAKHKEVYHIWWHPHNFGANIEQNMSFLESILKEYSFLHNRYGFESCTMNELCTKIINVTNNE